MRRFMMLVDMVPGDSWVNLRRSGEMFMHAQLDMYPSIRWKRSKLSRRSCSMSHKGIGNITRIPSSGKYSRKPLSPTLTHFFFPTLQDNHATFFFAFRPTERHERRGVLLVLCPASAALGPLLGTRRH